MKFEILKIAGPNCVTLDQGQLVYELVRPHIGAGTAVELDCRDVKVIASPFFNAAIGQLIRDFPPEELMTLLHVEGLTEPNRSLLQLVVENSREYYGDLEAKKIVDAMLEEHSRE